MQHDDKRPAAGRPTRRFRLRALFAVLLGSAAPSTAQDTLDTTSDFFYLPGAVYHVKRVSYRRATEALDISTNPDALSNPQNTMLEMGKKHCH